MPVWQIDLMGTPHALTGLRQIRPQAKETWALLASLLIPDTLSSSRFPDCPRPHSRDALAQRFWADKENPRVNLRQALLFIRKTFGEESICAGRETIQVAPGHFVTDIELMLTAYREAMAASSLDERLQHLSTAEAMIRGRFLEGVVLGGAHQRPGQSRA